nr:MAG TPA: hypothetical protein [Caudoviricetes sp.]
MFLGKTLTSTKLDSVTFVGISIDNLDSLIIPFLR